MQRHPVIATLCWLSIALAPFAWAAAGLQPGPGYHVRYHIGNTNVSAIDRVSDAQLAATAFSATQDVTTVALNSGPVGAPIFTQPALPSGSTFGGGFIATDGVYALTGQSGSPPDPQGLFPGRVFLARLSDGSSSVFDVPGNFDAAAASGAFYLSASAGTATGLADNASSGLYQLQHTGGTLTGLNLILDTGAPSGLLAADAAGNLAFSLGGTSPTLGGNANDLYRLTAAQVADALAAGPTAGLDPAAADRLITGTALANAAAAFFAAHTPAGGSVFTTISDLLFKPDGDLIVALSGILFDSQFNFAGSVGQTLLLDVTDNAGDHAATVSATIFTHDATGSLSLTYRASDDTLWVSDGTDLFAVAILPEPAALLLLALTLPLLPRRAAGPAVRGAR